MPRRKIENRNTRKLLRTSRGSVMVTLPIEIIRELKWRGTQKVTIRKSGEKIIIEDWKK
ncbi:MAG: hypothetical protein KAS07_04055 [Candidatus Pacebacteria bacterium]|nr:hypothetical protein [Candidatus Paceibacterota bacterium]